MNRLQLIDNLTGTVTLITNLVASPIRLADGSEVSLGQGRVNGRPVQFAFLNLNGRLVAHAAGRGAWELAAKTTASPEKYNTGFLPIGWIHGTARLVDPDLR